jgi:parvulin-like peptidyl-prolyl isomerase
LNFNKRIVRLALVIAVTAAVSFPLVNQLRNGKARAEAPPSPAPAVDPAAVPDKPKAVAISAFPNVDPAKVVLSVGDDKVTAGEFSAFFSELDPNFQARVLADPQAKEQLAKEYVDMKLLANEAKREKLDESSSVKTAYDNILANAVMTNLAKEKDANLKFYNDNKDYFSELQARHILIGTAGSGIESATLSDEQAHSKADAIRKRLDKGEDFAAIAKAESDDKGSGAQGGSLGPDPMTRGQMVPAFEEAAYALKDKEISQPVKTQFGYHIIQVLSRSTPAYEQVADRVPRRRMEVMLEDLKKAQKPVIDDSYFGATPAKAPATQPAGAK